MRFEPKFDFKQQGGSEVHKKVISGTVYKGGGESLLIPDPDFVCVSIAFNEGYTDQLHNTKVQ
jgi:hypothetical protein